jgi:hypothetical protein
MKIRTHLSVFVSFISLLFLSMSAFANQSDVNDTLHVYVKNMSREALTFTGVSGSKPGNEITVTPQVIKPGQEAVITAVKTLNTDIAAYVNFSDALGNIAPLLVMVQRQIHSGQPIFNVASENYTSELDHESLVRNKNIGPLYLTILEAKLQILSK